jgi:multicomponent Na+:H+ antiporter subunit E
MNMNRILLFILSFGVWLLLAGSTEGGLRMRDIAAGLLAALAAAFTMREITTGRFGRWLDPRRWFWALVYFAVLAYNIIKANFDVAYRVLHPDMPIRPGVVKVRTTLRTATAITALANSITLTPGTHVVDATPEGVLYVHWINVKTTDPAEATKIIVGRFEWVIKRIFE